MKEKILGGTIPCELFAVFTRDRRKAPWNLWGAYASRDEARRVERGIRDNPKISAKIRRYERPQNGAPV